MLEVKREKKENTFAEMGVTDANFRGNAKETPISSDVIERIYKKFPDVNLEWVITGEGQMFKQPTPSDMVSLDRYTELVRENERMRIIIGDLRNLNEDNNSSPECPQMALSAESIRDVQDEQDDLDEFDEIRDETLEKLKHSAFEALLLNPGSEFGDWQQTLICEYPSEVVDAYGRNPEDAFASLSDLWETPYEDTASGLEYTFETWAQCICNEAAVQMYYDFIEKLNNVSAIYNGGQNNIDRQ